jgi:hypothetical protein
LVRSERNSLTLSAPRTCRTSPLRRRETSDAMVSRRRPRSVNSRAYRRLSLRSRPLATRVLGRPPSGCAPLRSSPPCASPPNPCRYSKELSSRAAVTSADVRCLIVLCRRLCQRVNAGWSPRRWWSPPGGRRWAPGGARLRRRRLRRRRVLDRVPAHPKSPRSARGAAGHLRRPRRPQGCHQRGAARRGLATLPRDGSAVPPGVGPGFCC